MEKRKLFFGLVLIVLGLLFLGRSFGVFYFSSYQFWHSLFPLALIGLGFYLIVRKRRREYGANRIHVTVQTGEPSTSEAPGGATYTRESGSVHARVRPDFQSADKIKYHKGFGDIFIDLDGVNLQSVEVNSFVGDVEIKVHGGILAPGLNRMVISGFVGDVRVLVPKNFPVFAQASSFIGDVELLGNRVGGFGNNIDAQTSDYNSADSKLYIATNGFIGDVRVYQV